MEISPDDGLLQSQFKNSQALQNLNVLVGHLDTNKQKQLSDFICSHLSLFSVTPSKTLLIKHDIEVGDAEPINQRFYRVSEEKRGQLETEVHYMLDNGIAEPCSSNWASPCLLVKKPDGSLRPCTDCRRVNGLTKPDLLISTPSYGRLY